MKRPFLAVIDPAVQIPELECYNRIVIDSSLPATYSLPAMVCAENLPKDEPSAIVIMGSASSVNDGLEWQKRMNDWLMPLMEKGIPTLGFCYGHQLVAHLFGGKVEYRYPDQRKTIGFETVKVVANPLWGGECEGLLYVSHRELVTRPPSGFRITASRPGLLHDGLAHERLPIWSFQAHPEATPAFLKNQDIAMPAVPDPFAFGHSLVKAFLDRAARL